MDAIQDGEAHRSAVVLARDRLTGKMCDVLGDSAPGAFELLVPPREVADDVAKILFRTSTGTPLAVVLFAPPLFPRKVEETVEACDAARRALGEDLGSVIPEPLLTGSLEDRSYAVIPYCRPLSNHALWGRLQDARLRTPVFAWLREATRRTASELPDLERGPSLERPLEHLASLKEVSENVRTAARDALRGLGDGAWRPRTLLMHGDLWRGNILGPPVQVGTRRPSVGNRRFIITDWHGSRLRGYPIYDLVRLALSLRLGRRGLKRELRAHCEILGCEPRRAKPYLLAALGHLGMNLHCFPFDVYVRQVETCAGAL